MHSGNNYFRRFSKLVLCPSIKELIKKSLGELEHFKNVNTVAYVNSILIRGKNMSNYRHLNTHLMDNVNILDISTKYFLRTFSDSIITNDTYILKNKDLDNLLVDFQSFDFFREPYKNITIREDTKKQYYILSKNPNLKILKDHYFFKTPFIGKHILTTDNKYKKIFDNHNIQKDVINNKEFEKNSITFINLGNTDLSNAINRAIIDNSKFTFIEGFGNKSLKYLEEDNQNLNVIDAIVNCSIYYEDFFYKYKPDELKVLENKDKRKKKLLFKNKNSKEFNIDFNDNKERNKKIKHIGEQFVSENFEKNYNIIHSYEEFDEKLNGLIEFNVLKRNNLMFPVLEKEQKNILKIDKKVRSVKNKEKIKNLIRDN